MSATSSDQSFTPSLRYARKFIDTEALQNNYRQLKKHCASSQVLAVVKCNAYGHGMCKVAHALVPADGFAVTTVGEALVLRRAGVVSNILVMQGWEVPQELQIAATQNLWLTVSSYKQLEQLEQNSDVRDLTVWIKFDTGMNRLGFPIADAALVLERVSRLKGRIQEPVLMSHCACADETGSPLHARQLALFEDLCASYPYAGSIANSAACLQFSQTHYQWVRCGLAVYGAADQSVLRTAGLTSLFKPVMHLYAPIVMTRQCRRGESIGYGGTYVCPEDMQIGIVAIGYGDGYPWHISPSTPVWVSGSRQTILGRVSMDLIAISLPRSDALSNHVVELWGSHIPVEEVAGHCHTINYELLTRASQIEEVEHRLVE